MSPRAAETPASWDAWSRRPTSPAAGRGRRRRGRRDDESAAVEGALYPAASRLPSRGRRDGDRGQPSGQEIQHSCGHQRAHDRGQCVDRTAFRPPGRGDRPDHTEDQYGRSAGPPVPQRQDPYRHGEERQEDEDPELQHQLVVGAEVPYGEVLDGRGVRSMTAPPTAVTGPASGRTAAATSSATHRAVNPAIRPLSAADAARAQRERRAPEAPCFCETYRSAVTPGVRRRPVGGLVVHSIEGSPIIGQSGEPAASNDL